MHDTIHHLAPVTHVRWHAGGVLVLVRVRARNRWVTWVHCGIWEGTECCTVSRLSARWKTHMQTTDVLISPACAL